MDTYTTREAILQNLQDAGCGADVITRFMACLDSGRARESLCVLAAQRAVLLEELHASQDRLDCLDFLIYRLRKES